MTSHARVFVHIGLHKTGTTYLQNLLRVNRGSLLAQGVEYLGDEGGARQRTATIDLLGGGRRGFNDPRIPGAWKILADGINERGCPTVLISDEGLSGCAPKHVRRVVRSFPDREVHVIVTVRDLGRVVVSQWQEEIKNDKTWRWADYVSAIRDTQHAGTSAARGFWRRQDLLPILSNWDSAVPTERIHVVTVPPAGAPPEDLVHRFASVIGIDHRELTEKPTWNNETVGVAGTEVIRRVNEQMGGRLSEPAYSRAIKNRLAPMLATRTDPTRFALPDEEVGWVAQRADEMIAAVARRGYSVVGDLEDLRVTASSSGRRPDDVATEELLDAAIAALGMLTEEYATSWWVRKKEVIEAEHGKSGLVFRTRGARLAARRKTVNLVTRVPLLAELAGSFGRLGAWARKRSTRSKR